MDHRTWHGSWDASNELRPKLRRSGSTGPRASRYLTLNQFMFRREDARGPQDGAWLAEAVERARAQLASLRFDRP